MHSIIKFLALFALLILCACFVGEASSIQGSLILKATDASGNSVPGVGIRAIGPEVPKFRFVTDSTGTARIGGAKGRWTITLDAPAGYSFPATQPTTFDVKIQALSSESVSVKLTRTP